MQSVLLRRVAQLSSRLSRFLAERSADCVNGATPHNDDKKSHAVSIEGGKQSAGHRRGMR